MNVFSGRPRRVSRTGWMWVCSTTIAACSGQSQDANVGLVYAERVEAALKLPNPDVPPAKIFPSRRNRRHDVEPVRVSYGEWNDLESCAAGGLIAEANSPLGRVRGPFERVRHSQSLLVALHDCRDTMTPGAWAKFQEARTQKADQLDEERWNAFWVSESVERSFGRSTPLEDALRSEAALRWKELTTRLNPGSTGRLNADAWYAAESLLERTASVGEALHFMLQTTQALERVSHAVERSRVDRDHCLERDRRVIALMRGHYAKVLQPLMASGDQTLRVTTETLAGVFEELTPSEGIPPGMTTWAEQWRGQAAFERYRAATRMHASRIGDLLNACNETL